ncbi:MAG: hypothetical protein IMW97_06875 [Firmicutes bacterium]|nr:hypothetical protein [Candidatus Fermentithermobacillaceae bacterium]
MKSILGMPVFRPMLAENAEAPFDDGSWFFEVKWDGYRCLLYLSRSGARGDAYLLSRNGKDLGRYFPELLGLWKHLKGNCGVIDGEIVALVGGRPDFGALRRHEGVLCYVAFDILHFDGSTLTSVPFSLRRRRLESAVDFSGYLLLSEGVVGRGRDLFEIAKERDLEGIVAKFLESPYLPGKRSRYWLKVRNGKEKWFTVLGYRKAPGMRLGSLIVGENAGDELVIRGAVSSGLGEEEEHRLLKLLEPLKNPLSFRAIQPLGEPGLVRREDASCGNAVREKAYADVTWVVPNVRVLVSFTEMTAEGKLRHPVLRQIEEPRSLVSDQLMAFDKRRSGQWGEGGSGSCEPGGRGEARSKTR